MYTQKKPPVPYDEDEDPNIFWAKDPIEKNLKLPKGFITDWLYSLRGTQVPTLYTIWTALGLLSAVFKRDVWFNWQDDKLYPNLYILLIGPPSIKKSTSISKGLKLIGEDPYGEASKLMETSTMMNCPIMYHHKQMRIVMDKATPEYLMQAMLPDGLGGTIKDPVTGEILLKSNKEPIKLSKDSEVFIVAEELTALINKKKYNETMVELLTEIYDTKPIKHCGTKGEGKKVLRNLHTTLLGGTTPKSFQESIPIVAASDGFLSRCIFVYEYKTHRRFPFPENVGGAPSTDELRERLAWIACYTEGTHVLSPDARSAYDRWYMKVTDQLEDNPETSTYRARITQHVLKVALLLKAQRYDCSKIIQLSDFKLARKLVTETYDAMGRIITEMKASDYDKMMSKFCAYIEKYQPVRRDKVLRNLKFTKKQLDSLLEYYTGTGELSIKRQGNDVMFFGRHGDEEYFFTKRED